MDLTDALAYLDQHTNMERIIAGRKDAPTLERMQRLCAVLGDPQHAYPVIHITGTNGKGSTARMVTSLLVAHGLAVGTYMSPHVERIHERISRDGAAIDDVELAEAIAAVAAVEPVVAVRPNYFEILTAAAFRWFAEVAVDVAVVEVGMLGRWDATNVVDAAVAVVTNVGLDHTAFAGPTVLDVAREKAGVVKPGSTVVMGDSDPAVAALFRDAGGARTWERDRDFACERNRVAHGGRLVDIRTPSGVHEDVLVPLHGPHQGDNAAAAVTAVEAFFDRPLDHEVVEDGLAAVTVPGRFEVVERQPVVILDSAHNPDGARAAATTLDEEFRAAASRVIVVGMLRGHDLTGTLRALGVGGARLVVACAADWPKSVPAEEVAAAAAQLGADTEVVPRVADAVDLAVSAAFDDDLVFVTGSFYVVGEARSHLRGSAGSPARRRSP